VTAGRIQRTMRLQTNYETAVLTCSPSPPSLPPSLLPPSPPLPSFRFSRCPNPNRLRPRSKTDHRRYLLRRRCAVAGESPSQQQQQQQLLLLLQVVAKWTTTRTALCGRSMFRTTPIHRRLLEQTTTDRPGLNATRGSGACAASRRQLALGASTALR
jgi:hypothetical protein